MIKLYGIPASRACRCLWMLEELGIPYENVPISFVGDDVRKPEYLAKNPNGQIPTLEDDDGLILWESMAINLHLAQKYDAKAALWPNAPADRSHAIQWSFWGVTEIEPGLIDAFAHRALLPEAQRNEKVAKAGEAKIQRPLAVLDKELGRRSFLLGDRFTVADLNVASVFSAASFAKIDLAKYPNVQRWLGECMERRAAKRIFADLRLPHLDLPA